ncbi:HET-domain-containing protein [Fusarium keratoplasticum]|nr:HET-domain-containing protein [Fusarium keratoplasticum]
MGDSQNSRANDSVRKLQDAFDVPMRVAVQGYKKASLMLRDIENPEGKPLSFTIARLSQSDHDPAKSLTQVCVSEKEVATDRTFGLVKGWIQDCDTTHQHCHRSPGPLPTRVIQLQKGAPPRLYVSQREPLPYICLSYCWGAKQPVVTTTATLGSHLQELPVDQLPTTIKDALHVTERLGFEYLWIDALCIVQDSDDDKAVEVSKMHEVYQNSSLTICAARAETCLEGFLGPREMASVDFTIPFRLDYKATIQALNATVLLVEQNRTFKGKPMEPLHHRAWTMQETILSPRILLFSKYQLFFVCQEQAQQDGGIDDWNAYAEASSFHRLWGPRDSSTNPTKRAISDFELYFRPLASQDTTSLEEPSLQTTWERIMQDYSRRSISVPSDKLPALSSLATIFSQRTNLDYIAGMWKQWLPGALLWRLYKTASISRPKEWRAPTWSWLSVEGQVKNYENLSQLSSSAGNIAEIVECYTIPKTPSAPFGEISSAQLTISAFKPKSFEVDDWGVGEQNLYKKNDSDYPLKIGTAYLDLPMEDSPSDRPSRQVIMVGRLLRFTEWADN